MIIRKHSPARAAILVAGLAGFGMGSQALGDTMGATKFCDSDECEHEYSVNNHNTAFKLEAYCGNINSISTPSSLDCSSPNVEIACSIGHLNPGLECTCNHKQQKTTYKVNTMIKGC